MRAITTKVAAGSRSSNRSRKGDAKIRYEWLRDAIGAADSYMDRITLTTAPMMPYYCSRHSCWHTGHDRKAATGRALTYSRTCVARERLRREIAFLSSIIVDHAIAEPRRAGDTVGAGLPGDL